MAFHCMNIPQFIHPDIVGLWVISSILGIIACAAVNTFAHLWEYMTWACTFLAFMPKSGDH